MSSGLRNINTKEMSNIERILKLFINPAKAMDDVVERPNSYVAIFLILAIMIFMTVITFDAVRSKSLEESKIKLEEMKREDKELTENDIKEFEEKAVIIAETKVLLPIIFRLILIVLFAMFAMSFMNWVFRVNGTFKQYLAVVSHGAVILCISYILTIIAFLITKDTTFSENITKLKIFFLEDDGITSRIEYFAGFIDIVSILSFIITGYGFNAITKVSKNKIIVFMSVTYFLYILFGFFVAINIQY